MAAGVLTPTPTPTISGSVRIGSTVTAAPGVWGPEPVELSYQWLLGSTPIAGATQSSYTIQVRDAGKALSVRVTGSKTDYVSVAKTSTAAAVPVLGTVIGTTPKISDSTPVTDQVLTATPGTWGPSPVILSYQWYKGSTAIAGASSVTYAVRPSDVGGYLKVKVVGTKDGYASTSKMSAVTSAVAKATLTPTSTPTISDSTPTVDQVLTANPGSWGPQPLGLAYQWYKISSSGTTTKLTGATAPRYRVAGTDAGYRLKVTVTGTRAGYTAKSKTSVLTAAVAKAIFRTKPKPAITGIARVGMKLTSVPGTYDPTATYSYLWYRGTTAIAGTTASTYIATSSDLAKQLKVRVTASRSGYVSVTQFSDLTIPIQAGFTAPTPVINDTTPQVGQKLSITNTGLWVPLPDNFTYQWYRGSSIIVGATGASYTVTTADLAAALKVKVTGAKADFASVAKTSAATSTVAPGVFTAKPAPGISGDPVVGVTLTAVEGAWKPLPDSFGYQWYRSGTAISVSGTAKTYRVAAADVGKNLTVRVTAKKAGFTSASATSSAVIPRESTVNDLRVATFNLSGANNDSKAAGDHLVWADRLPVVVSQIVGENPDVVGLQEAYEGTQQYAGLRDALNSAGKTYEITDLSQSASRATRIMYNTASLNVLSKGAFPYAHQVVGRTARYLVWATFEQQSSGKEFLFVSTHLSPEDATVKTQQWRELVAKVKELNTAGLPVVVVGDFNTSKFMAGASEMLPAMKSAGFGDVMNQEYQVNPPVNPRAEKVVNGWINSFNGYRRSITDYSYSTARTKVGNGVDWIFATNALRVKQWKVVIDFDPTTLLIRGIIPSDHNMLSSVLVL